MINVKNSAGQVITTVARDLAVSMIDTGEAYVKHDPAFFPLLINADPGAIYRR